MKRMLKWLALALATGLGLGVVGAAAVWWFVVPDLPPTETLREVRYQVPLRIYAADGSLIGEFGEKRREPLRYEAFPPLMVQAILAAEDDRFFEHPGVDYQGILRAVKTLLLTGSKAQGGSTITMQVARNFFLSREKTFLRKFNEILLAFKIEQELTKEEILSLYLNKIYLGNRAYGFEAAAQVYYGKSLQELDVPQLAMLAGLPKAPSRYNPVVNPKRALERRNYVLRRMRQLGFIDAATYHAALQAPVTARRHAPQFSVNAAYAAEEVRREMVERYGETAYTAGYRVYTTIEPRLQRRANEAVQRGLIDYEFRYGYRGPEAQRDPLEWSEPDQWDALLKKLPRTPGLEAAVVLDADHDGAWVYAADGAIRRLCLKDMSWARTVDERGRKGGKPKAADRLLAAGDVVRIQRHKRRWRLAQAPRVQGALVSLRPADGAILAVVGGYDFRASHFNRATQGKRQPGSNFKPFIYSAALEKGFTAASLINDAPVVFDDPGLEDTWRPENYSGRFFGPTRLRVALMKSRNLVSIRLLRAIGIRYAIDYVQRFGFDPKDLPRDLSLALGSATLTPLSIARGYSVFANGGYLIEPYLITRIEDVDGQVIWEAEPAVVCPECLAPETGRSEVPDTQAVSLEAEVRPLGEEGLASPARLAPQVLDPRNVYIMTSILQDVIQHGTGRRARALKRHDLAGKTGTTNDQRDAWFSGFSPMVAATVWVGYDKPYPLGEQESGARAALPIWIDYMAEALKGVPEQPLKRPPGLVTVRIDPRSGLRAGADFPGAIYETFRVEHAPEAMVALPGDGQGATSAGDAQLSDPITEELF